MRRRKNAHHLSTPLSCQSPSLSLQVHGIIRRSSCFNTGRIDHIYRDRHETGVKLYLHYGDLCDATNLITIITNTKPTEIYNLGAMSHVKVSFDMPEYTADADGVGVLRMLNAIRSAGLEKEVKFYQASTSELYGLVQEVPQSETTPFYPRSPYAGACRSRRSLMRFLLCRNISHPLYCLVSFYSCQAVRLLDLGQLP